MLRFLLISDIHFLSQPVEVDPHFVLRTAFLKDICDYKETEGPIDHILVCGDIAFKGSDEEYQYACDFLNKVCDEVGCRHEEVYVVPGNHDKNFYVQNDEKSHLQNAGLANEDFDADKLFVNLLESDFSQLRTLYQPFQAYQKFAFRMDSTEPLMSKCLDDNNMESFNDEKDKAYMLKNLGYINDIPVRLYAMNSSLNSDWHDINDFGKGHKLFLSRLSYNADVETEDSINIVMMHHPLSNISHGEEIEKIFNSKFQIQIFGHLHKPVSYKDNCIHIHSGAFQPPKDEDDKSCNYFSVYNIVELDVVKENESDHLTVNLRVEEFDEEHCEFIENESESKVFKLPLKKHKNRWGIKRLEHPESLPEGVTERTVRYEFLRLKNPKRIISSMSKYDESKSHNKNCLDFLNEMRETNRLVELWNNINA